MWRTAACLFGLILIAASGQSHAAVSTRVSIPLDQADKRFGKFYVKSLDSILYRPANDKPAPTIVFMHGCGGIGGLTLQSAGKDATRFAAHGYATLILEPFDERNLKNKPCSDRTTSFTFLDARRADLDAAVKWLIANKISIPEKIVVLGTSHGGEVVIEHDQRNGGLLLAGGIALYPGCNRGTPFSRYPLLILVGEKDSSDGPGPTLGPICSNYMRRAEAAHGAKVEIVIYPGAGHAFDIEGQPAGIAHGLNTSVSGYQAAASKASREKIDAFLAEVFQ